MKKLVVVFILFALGISSCDTNPSVVNCDFDESAMLSNYADKIIIPRFTTLGTGLTLLDGAVQAFVGNPTIGLLTEIKVSYGAAYLQYQRCSPFAFGPGLINGVPFRERFNTFPTNTITIEQNVSNGVNVSTAPVSAVGFPALEYLIFGNGSQTEQQVLDLFTTDGNAANRKAYLQQLSAELKTAVSQIVQDWQSYRSTFISNTGTATGSSISLLVNDISYDFEILKNFKFKIPLGKLNGGVVLPDKVEGYYSGGTARLATEQASAFKDLFLGVGENQADGLGLYEYLECLKAGTDENPLANEISERFDDIIAALDAIPDPMSETLVSNKPIVDAAYTEMQMTVVKVKFDMTSALGVQISYQDNDGD